MEAIFTVRSGAIFNPFKGCDDSLFNRRELHPRLIDCLTLSGSTVNKLSFDKFRYGFLDGFLLKTFNRSLIESDPDTHSLEAALIYMKFSKEMLSQYGCLFLLFGFIYSSPAKETLKGLKVSKPMRSFGVTKEQILNPERVEQKLPIAA